MKELETLVEYKPGIQAGELMLITILASTCGQTESILFDLQRGQEKPQVAQKGRGTLKQKDPCQSRL